MYLSSLRLDLIHECHEAEIRLAKLDPNGWDWCNAHSAEYPNIADWKKALDAQIELVANEQNVCVVS
jgi:hypothetical protein